MPNCNPIPTPVRMGRDMGIMSSEMAHMLWCVRLTVECKSFLQSHIIFSVAVDHLRKVSFILEIDITFKLQTWCIWKRNGFFWVTHVICMNHWIGWKDKVNKCVWKYLLACFQNVHELSYIQLRPTKYTIYTWGDIILVLSICWVHFGDHLNFHVDIWFLW